ncbi:MAG TPA: HD domain-containing phosphohydrolase [Patescibacteria group bacterium]|nr:HD domain-containing phosphohydrolase [Patescibacteria group bacterium]
MPGFARAAGIAESALADIQLFARFHDIGKIGVADHILQKPGALTEVERRAMRQHCEIGYRIACAAPELAPIADWILRHHEGWDGSGYPLQLKGMEIELECRLLAIADSYDVMTNDRPYRVAMSHEQAIRELQRCAGTQFDPELVKVFVEMSLEEIKTSGYAPGRVREWRTEVPQFNEIETVHA